MTVRRARSRRTRCACPPGAQTILGKLLEWPRLEPEELWSVSMGLVGASAWAACLISQFLQGRVKEVGGNPGSSTAAYVGG